MTLGDLSNNLKQGKFLPVYIFEGDEPYFINGALDLVIEESLEDDQKDFNLNILYGRDTDSISIVNHSKRYPVMSDKNVVIVREAQDLKDIDSLSSYINNLNPNTILAIGLKGKKLDKRKSLYKSIRNNKDVLHISFKRLYENQIPYWIDSEVQNRGMRITQKAAILLTENIGSDLLRINHELEKICAFLGNKNEMLERSPLSKAVVNDLPKADSHTSWDIETSPILIDSYTACESAFTYFTLLPMSSIIPPIT